MNKNSHSQSATLILLITSIMLPTPLWCTKKTEKPKQFQLHFGKILENSKIKKEWNKTWKKHSSNKDYKFRYDTGNRKGKLTEFSINCLMHFLPNELQTHIANLIVPDINPLTLDIEPNDLHPEKLTTHTHKPFIARQSSKNSTHTIRCRRKPHCQITQNITLEVGYYKNKNRKIKVPTPIRPLWHAIKQASETNKISPPHLIAVEHPNDPNKQKIITAHEKREIYEWKIDEPAKETVQNQTIHQALELLMKQHKFYPPKLN